MERQFDRKKEQIREMVIKIGTLAEEAVLNSTSALILGDAALAKSILLRDKEIDNLENAIDKAIFEFLALKQPVASDLRLLFSVQKINKDLERIGDHAVNIAQVANRFVQGNHRVMSKNLTLMISLTRQMLSEALSSFTESDSKLALNVLEYDDQVDKLNYMIIREMIDLVKTDVTTVENSIDIISVSKNLERIADLSTNICEDVIFQADARDIKHQHISG